MTDTYNDYIDLDRCKYLFCLPDEELGKFYNEKKKQQAGYLQSAVTVRNTLAAIINGKVDVIERKYEVKPCNRMYLQGNGLQNMESNIKNFIMKSDMKDYDMKNCNPTILLYLYKKHNLPCSALQHYCDKRDNILRATKVSKQTVCALMNQDTPCTTGFAAIDNLASEVKSNKSKLIELEGGVIGSKKKPNDKNPLSSKQCSIIYYYENEILQAVMAKFKEQVSVPMYDGFNAIGECDLNVMNEISAPYGVTWCEKPLTTGFKMGDIDNEKLNQMLSEYVEEFRISYNDVFTAYGLSNKLGPVLQGKIVYSQKRWYVVRNSLWTNVDEILPYVNEVIHQGLDAQRNFLNKKINEASDEDKEQFETKLAQHMKYTYTKIDCASYSSQLIKNLKKHLEDEKFIAKLDKIPYKFIFKNGVYDMITKKFRKGVLPSDLVTKTLQYDYESTYKKEDKDWIMTQFDKMFCIKKHRDFFLSVLGYALCGDPSRHQHFYFMVGQTASNAKSTMLEILTAVYPEYVTAGSSDVLDKKCSDKHKFMEDFFAYRIVWLDEMAEDAKINGKLLKEISDGLSYKQKILYVQEAILQTILAKGFLLSNHTISFDKSDGGTERRYIHIQCDSKFDVKFTEDDYERKHFKADLNLIPKFKEKKAALTAILFEKAHEVYHKGFPDIPVEFDEEKKVAVSMNDEFKEWITDHTRTTDEETDRISKKEIIETYNVKCNINVKDRNVLDTMRQLGHKYFKDCKKDGKKGCFKYIKWNFSYQESYVDPTKKKPETDSDYTPNTPQMTNQIISQNWDSDSD